MRWARDYQNVENKSSFEPVTFVSVSGGEVFVVFSERKNTRIATLSSLFRSFASARVRVGERENEESKRQ